MIQDNLGGNTFVHICKKGWYTRSSVSWETIHTYMLICLVKTSVLFWFMFPEYRLQMYVFWFYPASGCDFCGRVGWGVDSQRRLMGDQFLNFQICLTLWYLLVIWKGGLWMFMLAGGEEKEPLILILWDPFWSLLPDELFYCNELMLGCWYTPLFA